MVDLLMRGMRIVKDSHDMDKLISGDDENRAGVELVLRQRFTE